MVLDHYTLSELSPAVQSTSGVAIGCESQIPSKIAWERTSHKWHALINSFSLQISSSLNDSSCTLHQVTLLRSRTTRSRRGCLVHAEVAQSLWVYINRFVWFLVSWDRLTCIARKTVDWDTLPVAGHGETCLLRWSTGSNSVSSRCCEPEYNISATHGREGARFHLRKFDEGDHDDDALGSGGEWSQVMEVDCKVASRTGTDLSTVVSTNQHLLTQPFLPPPRLRFASSR